MPTASPDSTPTRPHSIYGWVIVVMAALAMVATLPGRTHGLGMITERLLNDPVLGMNRELFADVNLWATLLGALFCLPCGWILDKCGLRVALTVVVAALGLVVITMTRARGLMEFAILITLTRGFGQSALSVISISMIGKWFRTRLPLATGIYSALVSIGFILAFLWGRGQAELAWRVQWEQLGQILLFGMTPLFFLLVRSAPRLPAAVTCEFPGDDADFTLRETLATPAFWVFAVATSLYGLASSGLSLFNESLLVERGFDKSAFYFLSMMTTGVGLAANLVTGWVTTRVRITTVASVAMTVFSAALLGLPFVKTQAALVAYAIAMGCAGGMVTVLFFAVWARLFGRTHLGSIQGVAQMLTVVASAVGPKAFARVKMSTGSYLPAIVTLGMIAAVLAVLAAIVPVPRRKPEFAALPALECPQS